MNKELGILYKMLLRYKSPLLGIIKQSIGVSCSVVVLFRGGNCIELKPNG
jgi:hypothetical protein